MLRLKSVVHNPLKSIRRFREAEPSFLRTPYCRIVIFFLIPCTLCLIPGLLPVANAKSVTIGWDPNEEPDLEGYVIYRNTNSPGPPYNHSDTLPEDEFDDPLHPTAKLTGLQEDKEYYIALTAYNTEGVESSYSNDICVEVVDNAVELCEESAGSPVTTSSSGGGGGGGSGGFACFISAASHSPSDKNFLPYILFILTAIGIGIYGYKKTVFNSAID